MAVIDRVTDPDRLRVLRATGLLEARHVPVLDWVTRAAVRTVPAPVSMLSLIEADHQVVVSSAGRWEREPAPWPRSPCRDVVARNAELVLPDLRAEGRWRSIDTVRGGSMLAYAGVPVRAGGDQALGALSMIDTRPRTWDAVHLETLRELAGLVEAEIATRLTRVRPHDRPSEHGEIEALIADDERWGFVQALLDSLDAEVRACDRDGRITIMNKRPLVAHPLSPGVSVWDLPEAYRILDADTRDPLRPEELPLARALAGEHVAGQRIVVDTPEMAARCLSVNGRPLDAPDGRRLGAVVAMHDITDQQRTEMLRAARHAVDTALAQAASVPEAATGVIEAVAGALGWCCGEYWQVDEDGESITRLASWTSPSGGLEAFTGPDPLTYARGEGLAGRAWDTGERIWVTDLPAEPIDFPRARVALRTGVRTAIAVPVHTGGRVLGVLAFFITNVVRPDEDLADLLDGIAEFVGRYMERRRGEDLTLALQASREHFDRVVTQINEHVWTVEVTPDHRVRSVYMSPNSVKVFGKHIPNDVDQARFVAEHLERPDDAEAFRAFQAELGAGRPAEVECCVRGGDGRVRWIWMRGAPRLEDGRVFIDGITTDVTERHRIEQQREKLLAQQREQVERLRTVDAMKDELMALVTHELRNPISSIYGYAELLLDAGLTGQQRTFAEVIGRKTTHLRRLVDDLLDLARLSAGHVSIDPRLTSLTNLLQEAVSDHRAAAEAQRLDLGTDLAPALHAVADPVRVRQMIDNLLSNAIKYTPAGGLVTVTARPGTGDAEGTVVISVADTGIGIPLDQYDQLFTRFFRATTAKEAGIKGTGLGLAITRAIITAHDGTITAAPNPGGGTVFTVRLPTGPPA
ncbi:ATP-binding protein [Spirillospora albida]|uniref:ATP-binding protein n=1 Tax=Spirillospora albida TaxID=58123 RepID=UPI0004BF681D|nr:ATP-binding protein [Spirillospora albida]